ncbi:hypothetical protein M413DRAFT_163160 [Hebeloma cylindrosporum]|uniref:Uncharacterized protein n=1 Tax=Hebeloma cylindrosporum TaxID=76867 RepID=A0A0C3BV50_HEBCY|nr:hypothetical protein M413DRAFT_163160 [Hebeloma cylindrosporum h7]
MNRRPIYAVESDSAEQSHGQRRDLVYRRHRPVSDAWSTLCRSRSSSCRYLLTQHVLKVTLNFPSMIPMHSPLPDCDGYPIIIIELGQDLSKHLLRLLHQSFEPSVVLPVFSTAHLKTKPDEQRLVAGGFPAQDMMKSVITEPGIESSASMISIYKWQCTIPYHCLLVNSQGTLALVASFPPRLSSNGRIITIYRLFDNLYDMNNLANAFGGTLRTYCAGKRYFSFR